MDPSFILNGSTLAAMGTVLGGLCGAITYLMRMLLASKDQEIKAVQQMLADQRAAYDRRIDALIKDRDYFRDQVVALALEQHQERRRRDVRQ